uniref:Uncharacterized protein n=1 Tax=Arthrobacter sp. J3.40 TaxID=347209 RepID=I3W162_9MICC|nr:hypothetical protein [Arthrobacter sp. J3.40]
MLEVPTFGVLALVYNRSSWVPSSTLRGSMEGILRCFKRVLRGAAHTGEL